MYSGHMKIIGRLTTDRPRISLQHACLALLLLVLAASCPGARSQLLMADVQVDSTKDNDSIEVTAPLSGKKIKLPVSGNKDVGEKQPVSAGQTTSGKSETKRFVGNAPCLSWIDPAVTPKAVVLCIHGLGLYNDSYADLGKVLSRSGIAVYAIDVRGFGSWMEARGHEKVNFQGCLDDVRNTLKAIHRAHPDLKVFVLGESMGGAIALRATAVYPELVAGLISSVPAGDRFQQKKTALKVAFHLIESPNKPFDVGTGVIQQATCKPELQKEWMSDPLNRLKLSANELIQFQSFMNQNHDSAKEITATPVLIVQGAEDRLVKPEGTVELYDELATPDKQLVMVEGSEHLIFEEHQFSDKVIGILEKWIDAHLGPKNSSQSVAK